MKRLPYYRDRTAILGFLLLAIWWLIMIWALVLCGVPDWATIIYGAATGTIAALKYGLYALEQIT